MINDARLNERPRRRRHRLEGPDLGTFTSGRLLTLEDTVEFFNLVLELKLSNKEKSDLVAFLQQI